MKRKLLYISQGRGGQVVYKDAVSEIRFYYEFGGGDCVAIIFIPNPEKWVQETKKPLSEREEIISFVASQATRDQVSNGYFKISGNYIEIYTS
jgi:hypothetical protein